MKKRGILILLTAAATVALSAGCVKEKIVYDDYTWVDLGLSVKWARANVGATAMEGLGDYFAWGEVERKDVYSEGTYKWFDGDGFLTKYCTMESKGQVDDKFILEPEDDPATAEWGSGWRTPTYEEFSELLKSCTWEWAVLNGVHGFKVISNVEGFEGNFIFLPANGNRRDGEPAITDYEGYYWTSTNTAGDHCRYSKSLNFRVTNKYTTDSPRHLGMAIRPVREEHAEM